MWPTVEVRRVHEFRYVDDSDPSTEHTLAERAIFGGNNTGVQNKAVDGARNIQYAARGQTGVREEILVSSEKETRFL